MNKYPSLVSTGFQPADMNHSSNKSVLQSQWKLLLLHQFDHVLLLSHQWWCGLLPSVLVPGLDLCVCQVESRRQVHAVLHAEVFLSLKAPLQLVELVVGKGCPCFARLFRAHRWTVSATGDLPVPFFFSPYTHTHTETEQGGGSRF